MSEYKVTNDLPERIFRAYDIRGVVEQELTLDVAYTVGRAIGSEAHELNIRQIVVGRDGRLSGPGLLNALQAGILSTGTDVRNIGEVPTPVLYYATHHLHTQAGVMVTGSHNPQGYNGFKMVLAGQTLFGDRIQALRERALLENFVDGQGELILEHMVDAYIERITGDITLKKPFNIVVDCGNGVTGDIVPRLFRELGCEVHELYCEVDGTFPHHHPDPSVEANLQDIIAKVKELGADIGLAFDGDGDRLGVVCDDGRVIWPDRQMMLFAIDILERHPGSPIIYDVKCSSHLGRIIKQHRGKPVMWKTGHSFIKTKMAELDSPMSGEMSGHLFFKERWYGFDDALYAGARLLEILSKQARSCSEVFSDLPDSVNTPELKLPIDDERKFEYMEQFIQKAEFPDGEINTIDGIRVDFEYGWGLVRASNTTPCLTLRFEADNEADLKKVQDQFRTQLLAIDSRLELPF